MSAEAEQHAARMFTLDCGQHVMTVRHDDGLYRHLAFRRPDTGLYWFDLITWPGHLAFVGDMGSYTFARTDDMLGFFLSGPGINPSYWAEKLQGDPGGRASARNYSEELFRQHVAEAFRDYADAHGWVLTHVADLWALIEDDVLEYAYVEHAAREAVHKFEHREPNWSLDPECPVPDAFSFTDAWEWHLDDYTHRFLYCCHAIRWGAEQYQAAKAVSA